MPQNCLLNVVINADKIRMGVFQINLWLNNCRADVAGNIKVITVFFDLLHRYPPRVAQLFFSELVGFDDFGDVLRAKLVLPFAVVEVLGGINEEDIVRFFAFLEDKNADRYAGRVKEIRRQADNGVYMAIRQKLGADALLGTATKEHAMGKDDGHDAFVFEEVESMEEEGEVCSRFGGEAMVFKAYIVAHGIGGIPPVAEWRIGNDGVEIGFLGGVEFAQDVPVVGEGVAVVDVEFRVFHPVQEHVHAGEVVGGDVLSWP